MGHYASEMDANWGQPTPIDKRVAEIDDELVGALARVIYSGYNSMSHLDSTNAGLAVNTAIRISELIDARQRPQVTPGRQRMLDLIQKGRISSR